MLKIHLVGGQSCEGKIFAVDPVTSAIVLQFDESGTGTSSFKLINSSRIVRIEGDMSTVSVPNISAFGISTSKAILKRESDSKQNAEKAMAALNDRVDSKIQSLFDIFHKIYPCRWDNNSIIVLDSYIISPPSYDTIALIDGSSSGDPSAFKRLEKMLESERLKIGL